MRWPRLLSLASPRQAVERRLRGAVSVLAAWGGGSVCQVPDLAAMNLHTAARTGDLEAIGTCLLAGVALNDTDDHSRTPLHLAAWAGHVVRLGACPRPALRRPGPSSLAPHVGPQGIRRGCRCRNRAWIDARVQPRASASEHSIARRTRSRRCWRRLE